MTDADHRPVFEITSRIRRDTGWLPVQMVKQLAFLGNDPRVVPLTGFNLHDDHTAATGRIRQTLPAPSYRNTGCPGTGFPTTGNRRGNQSALRSG